MQPKIFITLLLFCAAVFATHAQDKNPYKELGKKGEILTLTKGQFNEFFDDDDVQQIGTSLVNIRTMKVVKMMSDGEAEKRLDNTAGKRFLSVDPLTTKYPMLTPYQFASNTPIQSIDLDGLEEYHYTLSFNKEGKPQLAYSKTVMEKTFLFWSYRPSERFVVDYKGESFEFTPAGYSSSPLNDWTANSYDKLTSWLSEGHTSNQFDQTFYSTGAVKKLNAGTYAEMTTDDVFKGNAWAKSNARPVKGTSSNNNIKFGGRTIIVDENLSPQIASELKSKGYNIQTFAKGTSDADIIDWAKNNNGAVLTNNIRDFKGKGVMTIEVPTSLTPRDKIPTIVTRIESMDFNIKAHGNGVYSNGTNINLEKDFEVFPKK